MKTAKKTTYLAADTTNGVYSVQKEDIKGDLLSGEDFIALLPYVEDDEVIFAAIDDDRILEKISSEYEIN